MTDTKLTYVSLAPITKFERSSDGNSLFVYGKATDETLDSDGQIVDLEWASKAISEWLTSGANLRVQHNPSLYPAGIGVELEVKSDGAYVTGEVVEPTAMRLVEKRALTSYSVGIANPKVVRDLRAPHGRIVGGQIAEISLVDRPANPSCGIKLMKSADGQFAYQTLTKADSGASEDVEDGDGDTDSDSGSCSACNGSGKNGDDTCSKCGGSGDAANKNVDNNKTKKVKKNGNKLGESPRRSEGVAREKLSRKEATRASGSNEDEGSHKNASSERPVSPDSDADHPSQNVAIENVDLTTKTAPVISEVDKRKRGTDGKWRNDFDSTDPQRVVGSPTYDGQANSTTDQDTNLEGEATDRAIARASSQGATLPVTVNAATSQQSPPPVTPSGATKAEKKYKKAQRKIRKQAKALKALRKANKELAPSVVEDSDVLTRWNELVTKSKKQDEQIETLTSKLEKISSTPTLGKAIRAPQSIQRPPVIEKSAEAYQRAQDQEKQERITFLEGVARTGDARQQDAAQDMLLKLRAQLDKTT